jgi:hypothetical protein
VSRLSDIEINCAVRRVLVRHWIDLGKISLRTTQGVVWLSGALTKLPKVTSELTPATITEMINDIRRTSSVRRVQCSFSNWVEQGGGWTLLAQKTGVEKGQTKTGTSSSTIDLTNWENVPEKVEALMKERRSSA